MLGRSNNGFTLLELMVVCAIIAILAAVAIPQYTKFRWKAMRAEATVVLNGGHKSQMAYYAGTNHFMTGGTCYPLTGPLNYCSMLDADAIILNQNLGLPTITNSIGNPTTPHGYVYSWNMSDALQGYEIYFWRTDQTDWIFIGVNGIDQIQQNCRPCGWQDGVPFIYHDGLTGQFNCPC